MHSAELQEFLDAPPERNVPHSSDRLLASDDYPVRMRELWDVILMGRPKRERGEDQRRKNGWWKFLETNFRTNRPWNETVRAILVARPDQPEDQGASWFLYERRNDHQAIAEAVAPVVYGTKINCAQCHDHPLAREIKQAHYWGLVAAFNRSKNIEGGTDVSRVGRGRLCQFHQSQKGIPARHHGIDERPHGRMKTGPARDQKEDDSDEKYVDPKPKPRVPKFSRRVAFAQAATVENPLLARAFVNRLWSVFLGRGIIQPADEMNARNAPSHPELLDWLSEDFAAHRYDIRREVRGIVLSQVYALGVWGRLTGSIRGSAGTPAFRRATCPLLAHRRRSAGGKRSLRRATIEALPDVLPKDYNATYQQAQFLANSSLLGGMLKPAPDSAVKRLVDLPGTPERVRAAFLEVFARLPDAREAAQAEAMLKSRSKQPGAAVRDLLWAMMTSAEFLTMP